VRTCVHRVKCSYVYEYLRLYCVSKNILYDDSLECLQSTPASDRNSMRTACKLASFWGFLIAFRLCLVGRQRGMGQGHP
jgi:hypothetical protein